MPDLREGPPSPWHDGEIAIQQSLGVSDRMRELGTRIIRDHLIDQHREFFAQLPFVVLGAVDARGDAWATLRAGAPGFLHAPDPHTLHANLARDPADPADAGMNDGDAIALLGIELHTRRRNRLNGVVRRAGGEAFDVDVRQSYGNCPKYIQLRHAAFSRDPGLPSPQPAREVDRPDPTARALIERADTFFVASYVDAADGTRQVDVSHRGGKPGFVRIGTDGVLTIPDFTGNFFFNTLGNLRVNPRAGLVFVDFENGDLLQITGDADVLLDSPETATFRGAERLWRVAPRRILHRPGALPLRWASQPGGLSPFLLKTDDWRAVTERAQD